MEILKAVIYPEEDKPVIQGRFQSLRDWWKRNTKEIKLVSVFSEKYIIYLHLPRYMA